MKTQEQIMTTLRNPAITLQELADALGDAGIHAAEGNATSRWTSAVLAGAAGIIARGLPLPPQTVQTWSDMIDLAASEQGLTGIVVDAARVFGFEDPEYLRRAGWRKTAFKITADHPALAALLCRAADRLSDLP